MVEQPTLYVPRIEDTNLQRSKRTGYWQIEWTVPADQTGTGRARTRTYSCRTKDETLAKEIRREWLAGLSGAAHGAVLPKLGDLIDLYKRDYIDKQGIGPSQWESLKPVKRLMGPLGIDGLDDGQALEGRDGYVPARTLEGVSSGTIRRELGALVACLNWGKSSRNLPKEYVLPVVNLTANGQARDYFLSEAEEAKLHAAAEDMLKAVVSGGRHPAWRGALFTILALNTAGRAEAIEGLDWSRVTLGKPALIDLRDQSRRHTKKRRGHMPVSDRLLPVLTAEWVRQGQPVSGPVLGTYGSTRKAFETVKALAFGKGSVVARELHRHDLRRTWATLAVMKGVRLEKVAQVLADTLETTEKHYAHFAPDFLTDAINQRA